ncbi:hypothetical protein AAY473_012568 [Plecturocebus cupreus]
MRSRAAPGQEERVRRGTACRGGRWAGARRGTHLSALQLEEAVEIAGVQGRAQLLRAALAEGQLRGRGAGGRLGPEGIEGASLVRVLQRQVDPVEQLGRLVHRGGARVDGRQQAHFAAAVPAPPRPPARAPLRSGGAGTGEPAPTARLPSPDGDRPAPCAPSAAPSRCHLCRLPPTAARARAGGGRRQRKLGRKLLAPPPPPRPPRPAPPGDPLSASLLTPPAEAPGVGSTMPRPSPARLAPSSPRIGCLVE